MEATYKTETRHHPEGKTCHHFARYRLTCDEFDALRERAAGRCEICKTPEPETAAKKLGIDHFHGRPASYVRGLLCDRCNSVMGCYDGNKPWGPRSLPWKRRAEEYAANSWQTSGDGLRVARLRGPIDRL